MRTRPKLLTAALTAALALLLATSALTSATASAQPSFVRYLHYVALGDSYTSGPFIPLQRLDPLGCARSTSNYPAHLAAALRVRSYTDVSCAGATTANMTQPQSVPLGTNPPQFSALRLDTDLVTIGIGGNDYGVFGTLVGTCPSLRASDPSGNPCQRYFTVGGVDTMKAAIANTEKNVETVLAGVHQLSPGAKVLVIGYPRIAPPSGYCPAVLPFADGDYAWLNSVEETLDAALATAAANDGQASYVDTFGPSLGHDACATGGAAWINGQYNNLLAAAAYHPFANEMAAVAGIAYHQLEG